MMIKGDPTACLWHRSGTDGRSEDCLDCQEWKLVHAGVCCPRGVCWAHRQQGARAPLLPCAGCVEVDTAFSELHRLSAEERREEQERRSKQEQRRSALEPRARQEAHEWHERFRAFERLEATQRA